MHRKLESVLVNTKCISSLYRHEYFCECSSPDPMSQSPEHPVQAAAPASHWQPYWHTLVHPQRPRGACRRMLHHIRCSVQGKGSQFGSSRAPCCRCPAGQACSSDLGNLHVCWSEASIAEGPVLLETHTPLGVYKACTGSTISPISKCKYRRCHGNHIIDSGDRLIVLQLLQQSCAFRLSMTLYS